MKGKKAIYGFADPDHAIPCTIESITFKGTEIIITASCDSGTITAPIEMFKMLE